MHVYEAAPPKSPAVIVTPPPKRSPETPDLSRSDTATTEDGCVYVIFLNIC